MSFSPPKLVKIVQNGGNQRELGFGNQTLLHLPLWIQAGQLFWEAMRTCISTALTTLLASEPEIPHAAFSLKETTRNVGKDLDTRSSQL